MKNLKLIICLLAIIPFIASCSDDDDKKGLTFSTDKIEVIVGQKSVVSIKNGDGTYTVTPIDSKIATATVDKKDVTITGVALGTTMIKVKDKSGQEGVIKATVIKDPYEEMKADATTRFVWNKISKIKGKDAGTYTLTEDLTKVEFKYTSEDKKNTILLSFTGRLTPRDINLMDVAPIKKEYKLIIDGKESKVDELIVVQDKKVGENKTNTLWIAFKSEKQNGVCVATLNE